MKTKKTKKADLENKRNMFFLFGLVTALGLTLLVFEWKTKPNKLQTFETSQPGDLNEEIIPITREPIQKLLPPPTQTVEILNIVDNDVEIKDDLVIEDSEADGNTLIDVNPILNTLKEEEEEEPNQIFFITDEQPEFSGGDRALLNYINTHVKYPNIAQENGVFGWVTVRFVVNEEGKVSNAQVVRGVDRALDAEALRVINSLPDFKPGKQGGRPVKVYYHSYINFVLN